MHRIVNGQMECYGGVATHSIGELLGVVAGLGVSLAVPCIGFTF